MLSDLLQKAGDEEALARDLVATAATTAPSTPIVHLVDLPEDVGRDEALGFERVLPGDDALATAVMSTRGIHLTLGPAEADDDRTLALHLLRPTRLDDVRLFVDGRDVGVLTAAGDATVTVRGFGADEDGVDGSDALATFLAEGDGLRVSARLPPGVRYAEVRALAWADDVGLPLTPLPTKVATAAIATASNLDLRDVFDSARDALDIVARRLGWMCRR